MTHSPACTNLVAGFEGCELSAYKDGNGIPTIGFGHTGGVQMGDTCTQEQALEWLSQDLNEADKAVNRYVAVPMTQNMFDALASLTYNIGPGNFLHSTALRLLNQGDKLGAASAFLMWDKINGQVSTGLTRRRLAERDLFMTPEQAS